MQMPIVQAAPLVKTHAEAFRDLFENRPQFEHFQEYVTGLMVLDNKTLANMARCIVDSADKTNWSRSMSEAPWFANAVNDRRVAYMIEQTQPKRRSKAESLLVIDDTLCEHVGSLFEYIDRHYDHGEDGYPLAHNPVTSLYVSGVVRFPVDLRLYRRYKVGIPSGTHFSLHRQTLHFFGTDGPIGPHAPAYPTLPSRQFLSAN